MIRSFRVLALVASLVPVVAFAQSQSTNGSPPTLPPPGPTQAPPVTPTPDTTAQATTTDQPYNVRLRNIEERVNDLKEKVFQSKARLIQLQEVVLHGAISGAKAVLIHRNEMGGTFRLTRIQYALDGAPIYNRVATGDELNAVEEVEIFNGSVAPGNHQISVYLEYQGNGYGVFSYLKDYTFRVKSSQTLVAEEGKITTMKIVGYEKGGLTTELKDRPQVRYEIEVAKSLSDDRAQKQRDDAAKAVKSDAAAGGSNP